MAKGSFALWNCSVSLLRRKTWENFFPPVCQLQFPSPKFPAWLKYLNQLHLTAFSSIPSSWGKAQQPGKTHLPFLNFRAGLLCSCFLKSAVWDVAQHLLEFESAAPQARVLILHPLCLAHKLHVVTSYCFKDKDCSRHLSLHLNYSSLGIIYSSAWVILLCWSTWLLLLTGKKTNPQQHAIFFVLIEILWLFQAADWALITPGAGCCQVLRKCRFWVLEGAAKSSTRFSVTWPSSEFLGGNRGLWERATDYVWFCTWGVWSLMGVIFGNVRDVSHPNCHQSSRN